jgi:hypothetical protein
VGGSGSGKRSAACGAVKFERVVIKGQSSYGAVKHLCFHVQAWGKG